MDWRIYYDDGSTYSDATGPWKKAPTDGVACVAVAVGSHGRRILTGGHGKNDAGEVYLKFPGEQPTSTNDFGPSMRRTGIFKFGRILPEGDLEKYMNRAATDPGLPAQFSPRRRHTDWCKNCKQLTHPGECKD